VPGAKNDLILTGREERTLHRIDLSHFLIVRLGPVGHNQPQTCSTVGSGADILGPADCRDDFPRYLCIVIVHSFLLDNKQEYS
jgi:hypothetical protein